MWNGVTRPLCLDVLNSYREPEYRTKNSVSMYTCIRECCDLVGTFDALSCYDLVGRRLHSSVGAAYSVAYA